MDAVARVTSQGRVTVPKAVREALGIKTGDTISFRLDGDRAALTTSRDFLDLAGTVSVPAAKRDAAWDDVLQRTRSVRARRSVIGAPARADES